MARPTKQGIEYFPVDVQFDEKVELYIAECGAEGFGILVTVWQIIYQNEGYFVKNNDDLVLLVRRRIMSQAQVIRECIRCAIVRGVFDEKLEKKYGILTSKGIQKRYLVAANRKKVVSVNKNYLHNCIIASNNLPQNIVFEGENTTKEEVEEEVEGEGNENNAPLIPYEEIIGTLNNLSGKSFRHSSVETRKHIKARWNEGFSLEDFNRVITDRCELWKDDKKMLEYLRPRTIFGPKFESYLQASIAKNKPSHQNGKPNCDTCRYKVIEKLNCWQERTQCNSHQPI